MIAEGRDPTPIPADRLEAVNRPAKPIDYDSYLPERHRSKFIRMRVAEFNIAVAEQLRDLTYDRLKEIQWMQSAHAKAVSTYQDSQKTHG